MTKVEGYVEWINEICVGELHQHLAVVGRKVCLTLPSGNIPLYLNIIQSAQLNA
jgi:hypothetical protein